MVESHGDDAELDLRDYLQVLRRRVWPIVTAVLVVAVTTVVLAKLETPLYRATSEVLIRPSASQTLFNNGAPQQITTNQVATEIQVLKSRPVRDAVQAKLSVAPAVSVSQVGQTDVIAVSASSTDPARAAAVANAYATSYVDFRQSQDVNNELAAASQIQVRISDLQHQIDAANAEIAAGGPTAQATLRPQVDNLVQQQGAFKQQLAQLQVEASLNTGGASLVSPATTPTSPVSPRVLRSAVVAVAVGLIFGVGVAFLLEYLDDSIKSKEDLDRVATNVPNLALIPMVSSWRSRDDAYLVSRAEPKSPAAEAYRSLRTALQFASLERPLLTLQVTSPAAGEGKSTTVANLAVAIAQTGKTVVLCCCDLRRPRVHEFFGLDNAVGFTSVLLGEVPVTAALQAVDGVPGLQLLASGPAPPNPSELLSSRRAAEAITALQAHAEVVLLDSPPILPVTDAAVLSTRVDATLVVAAAGVTTRKELARALEMLGHVDAPVIGTVLNGVGADGSYGYGRYGSYQAYGVDNGKRQDRRGRKAAAPRAGPATEFAGTVRDGRRPPSN